MVRRDLQSLSVEIHPPRYNGLVFEGFNALPLTYLIPRGIFMYVCFIHTTMKHIVYVPIENEEAIQGFRDNPEYLEYFQFEAF
jgi:hypothetical protein